MIVALLYLLLVESAPAIRLTYSSPSSPVTDWTLEVGGEVWSAAVPVSFTHNIIYTLHLSCTTSKQPTALSTDGIVLVFSGA